MTLPADFGHIVQRWTTWMRLRRALSLALPGLLFGLGTALGFTLAILGQSILVLSTYILLSAASGLAGKRRRDALRLGHGLPQPSQSHVGRFSPQGDSPSGCCDMIGNVWEWTSTPYGDDGDIFLAMGTGWDHYSFQTEIPLDTSYRNHSVGFRVVRDLR